MQIDNPIFSLRASERLLLSLIRKYSPSRAELSQLSGLSPGAITQYCRKLLFLGLIKENQKAVKKRGQPSFHIELNQNACCSIGITFLSEEFCLSIVDFCGNKIVSAQYVYKSKTNLDILMQQMKTAIQKLLEKKFLTAARILGMGFSVSGYITSMGSYSSPWFPLLQNQKNLTALFEESFGCPCWIENNINTIAIGEYYSGKWNAVNDIVVISLDFGVGAGTISQGRLIQGGFGNAGEVGLLFAYGQPRPSWKNLMERLNLENIEQSELIKLIKVKDPNIQTWLSDVKPQILSLVLSAIAWVDPKVVVITGMLPVLLNNEIIDYIHQSEDFLQFKDRPIAQLSTSQIGIEDISIGAAILPIHFLLQEK